MFDVVGLGLRTRLQRDSSHMFDVVGLAIRTRLQRDRSHTFDVVGRASVHVSRETGPTCLTLFVRRPSPTTSNMWDLSLWRRVRMLRPTTSKVWDLSLCRRVRMASPTASNMWELSLCRRVRRPSPTTSNMWDLSLWRRVRMLRPTTSKVWDLSLCRRVRMASPTTSNMWELSLCRRVRRPSPTTSNMWDLSLCRRVQMAPHPALPKKPNMWDLRLFGDMYGCHYILPLPKGQTCGTFVSLETCTPQGTTEDKRASGHERESIWTTRDKRDAASTPSGPQRTSGTLRSGTPSDTGGTPLEPQEGRGLGLKQRAHVLEFLSVFALKLSSLVVNQPSRHAKGSDPVFEELIPHDLRMTCWESRQRACKIEHVDEAQLVALIICKYEQIDGCCVADSLSVRSRCRQVVFRMLLTLAHITSQL